MAAEEETRTGRRVSLHVPLTLAEEAMTGADAHHHGHSHHHHHIHTPISKEKALAVESLCFEPIFNAKYNEERVSVETFGFLFLQRSLPLVIGLLTAGTAVTVATASEQLGDLRISTVNNLIGSKGWVVGWLAECGIMAAMALLGGFFVYFGRLSGTQTAGSSGIPQLIALLNGCDLRHEFSVKHLFVKWFGVCLSVASGLAVGPEGPMIFIGSAIGCLCSRLPQSRWLWSHLGQPPVTVPDDVFTRDYTSIGAGCGIAAAFRAPIAGTLFIVEEAASHFHKEQMSNIFLGGLAALEVILLTGGAGAVLEYKVATGSGCSSTPWWSFIFLVVIGVTCGIFGALFNALNISVMRFRAKYCNANMPFRRAMELVLLSVLSSTAWIVAAGMFGESDATSANLFRQSDGCIRDNWRNQIITGGVVEHSGEDYLLKYKPAPCLFGVQYDSTLCPTVLTHKATNSFARTCIDAVHTDAIRDRTDSNSYCCAFKDLPDLLQNGAFQVPDNASCAIELGERAPSLKKDDDGATYSTMGILALVPFKAACQNLFARGIPYLISLPAMLVFFVLFFTLAAITAGSAIPSGLLMPQMVIGALIGRIGAIIIVQVYVASNVLSGEGDSMWAENFRALFSANGGPISSDTILTPETAGYLDPGIGAIIGAAAFLGGSGRVVLFTTVMMVEISGDPVMIFPVGFATFFAVLVGNAINHGLYHSLLDVQSQPYLPDTWQEDQLPPGIFVKDMMPRNTVAVIERDGGREGIHAAIDGNSYLGFPLVDEDGVVIGLCERPYLEQLLKDEEGVITPDDIMYISDLYPLTVRQDFPLQSAYQLFKSMDMKNLIVVDDNHRPVAVMTRFAFLAWRVAERLGTDRMEHLRSREAERRSVRNAALRTTSMRTRSFSDLDDADGSPRGDISLQRDTRSKDGSPKDGSPKDGSP